MDAEERKIVHEKEFKVSDITYNIGLIDSIKLKIYSDSTYAIGYIKVQEMGVEQSGFYIALLQLQIIAIQYAVRYIQWNYDGTRLR